MSDNHSTTPSSETPPKKRRLNKILVFIAGFFMSLAIGWLVENVTDREFLEGAKQAQDGWIKAVSETSPIAVGSTYMDELGAAFSGHHTNPASYTFDSDMSGGQGIASPFVALVITATRFLSEGGITAIVQLILGAPPSPPSTSSAPKARASSSTSYGPISSSALSPSSGWQASSA